MFYNSSTNAYMLMYRQVDEKENKSFTHQSEWSPSLKDLCQDILNDEHKELNRKEWERNVCKVKIFLVYVKLEILFIVVLAASCTCYIYQFFFIIVVLIPQKKI